MKTLHALASENFYIVTAPEMRLDAGPLIRGPELPIVFVCLPKKVGPKIQPGSQDM
jgi:hypothetical protein